MCTWASPAVAAPEEARLDEGPRDQRTPYALEIAAGYTARGDQQTSTGGTIGTRGGTLSHGHVDLAIYPGAGALGVWLRAAGERFQLRERSTSAMPASLEASLLETALGVAGRQVLAGAIEWEGFLGYGYQSSPVFGFTPMSVDARTVHDHGPVLGTKVAWQPAPWLGFQLHGRGVPLSFGASLDGDALTVRSFEAGGGVRLADVEMGGIRFAGLVEYTFGRASIKGDAVDLSQKRHLIAFGLRATRAERPVVVAAAPAPLPLPPPAPSLPPPPPPPPLEAPPPAASPPAAIVRGTLWARAVAGAPGRMRRVPLGNAAISWQGPEGATTPEAARSDARGQFVLDGLAAGAGTLRIEAPGFQSLERPMTVANGESQAVDLTLDPTAEGQRSVIRGTVRTDRGRRVRATLEVPEVKARAKPSRTGAFTFEVPPGRYTLKVSAPGYVTQRKAVELAGGEESIFSIELRRRHRR